MRIAAILFSMLVLGTPAGAFGPNATGKEWGEDRHREWIRQWAGAPPSIKGDMVETCLDAITTGEDGTVPRKVAKIRLMELTLWCMDQVQPHLNDPTQFRDKTFRYPDGMVPNGG